MLTQLASKQSYKSCTSNLNPPNPRIVPVRPALRNPKNSIGLAGELLIALHLRPFCSVV